MFTAKRAKAKLAGDYKTCVETPMDKYGSYSETHFENRKCHPKKVLHTKRRREKTPSRLLGFQ